MGFEERNICGTTSSATVAVSNYTDFGHRAISLSLSLSLSYSVCVRVCARASVRVCMYVRVCVCVGMHFSPQTNDDAPETGCIKESHSLCITIVMGRPG